MRSTDWKSALTLLSGGGKGTNFPCLILQRQHSVQVLLLTEVFKTPNQSFDGGQLQQTIIQCMFSTRRKGIQMSANHKWQGQDWFGSVHFQIIPVNHRVSLRSQGATG